MTLRLAVLSDLHGYSVESKKFPTPSYLNTRIQLGDATLHPMRALHQWLDNHPLSVDYLVCPGDLCHQADMDAAQAVWKELDLLATKLKARRLLAVTGNHDLDSRYRRKDTYHPRDHLKIFNPLFPVPGDVQIGDRYWADDVAVITDNRVRVLLINTCSAHLRKKETDHGRITPQLLSKIKEHLSTPSENFDINLAICHHHLDLHAGINDDDYDYARDGQHLLELFGNGEFGPWLVVHGHKHHPRLNYASGGNLSAVVFAAGSFSVCLPPKSLGSVRNTFHIVDALSAIDRTVKGEIRTLEYVHGVGWDYARDVSALPYRTGFGFRGDLVRLTESINAIVPSKTFLAMERLKAKLPEIGYLVPVDRKIVFKLLRSEHGVDSAFDSARGDTLLYRDV